MRLRLTALLLGLSFFNGLVGAAGVASLSTAPKAPLVLNPLTTSTDATLEQPKSIWVHRADRFATGTLGLGEIVLGVGIFFAAFRYNTAAHYSQKYQRGSISLKSAVAGAAAEQYAAGWLGWRAMVGGSVNIYSGIAGKRKPMRSISTLNHVAWGVLELTQAVVCGAICLGTKGGENALMWPGCLALVGVYDLCVASDVVDRSSGYTLFRF